jgi:hypothetical protein
VVSRVQDILLDELHAYYFTDLQRYEELRLAFSTCVSSQSLVENPSLDTALLPFSGSDPDK